MRVPNHPPLLTDERFPVMRHGRQRGVRVPAKIASLCSGSRNHPTWRRTGAASSATGWRLGASTSWRRQRGVEQRGRCGRGVYRYERSEMHVWSAHILTL